MNASPAVTDRAAWEAAGEWYHAWFTGIVLMAVSRRGPADAADLVFRIFRRQQQATFLPGLAKLGLSGLPPAVAAARYHYLSNFIGGVGVEYVEESPRKAWIRYPPPRWVWPGPAICGIPSEVNAAMLRGWHANNGVMLGRLGLGFVCTGQTVDGDPGLEGYYIEHERDLAEEERLRFAKQEIMPRFDPAAAPRLPSAGWPAERLAKAKRGYAMEYCRSAIEAALALFGPEQGGALLGHAARLTAMQHVHATAAALGVQDFAAFLVALARGEGDAARVEAQPDGSTIITREAVTPLRGIADPAAFAAWEGLLAGALAAWDRFARLQRIAPLAWRLSGR
ncbi:hypothetical protein GXW77_17880 [Roseomonas alkaliterrae]|uniref:Uncharacterized protein n=1 Tax=Neoroseomonas alkaliterrae TaxID=1452450 RepID=A0A840XLS7_9PROT|nr:hypothetical protein [Neoroseomonas alkaliterrae]MBB5689555.1 hypothetical protein [Neoroseomonas alkaliterrae]MBR0678043.1 hypothetical protein [Neoroseomonas alkaliterrae]